MGAWMPAAGTSGVTGPGAKPLDFDHEFRGKSMSLELALDEAGCLAG